MKTPIYKPTAIRFIQFLILLFGLQINFLFAVDPTPSNPVTTISTCVTCSNSVLTIQKEELSDELILLEPTTPAEANFTDETEITESNSSPATVTEPSSDNDPESISPCILECLAPTTPAEADFND
jgi:hypothetical protein